MFCVLRIVGSLAEYTVFIHLCFCVRRVWGQIEYAQSDVIAVHMKSIMFCIHFR